MTFHINPETDKSEWRTERARSLAQLRDRVVRSGQPLADLDEINSMSDPEQSGYRPAIEDKMKEQAAEMRAFLSLPPLVAEDPARDPGRFIIHRAERACPDRRKAIDEYRHATSWEDTDRITREPQRRPICWTTAVFLAAMVLGALNVAVWVVIVVMK